MNILPKEWRMKLLYRSFQKHSKINFPQILNFGECRSTRVFHGEHFSLQYYAGSAFHRLYTAVDISLLGKSGFLHELRALWVIHRVHKWDRIIGSEERLSHNEKTLRRTERFLITMIKTACLTVLVKSPNQVLGDQLSRAAFDLVPLDHVHQLTILEQGNCR